MNGGWDCKNCLRFYYVITIERTRKYRTSLYAFLNARKNVTDIKQKRDVQSWRKVKKRKVLATAHRHDETEIFEKINQRFGFLLTYMPEQLTLENTERLKGYDADAINAGCKVDQDMARAMQAAGIRFIATRTAGKDHIDKDEIKKCGIKAANVPGYSPNAISEHTVLLILSLLRKMKTQLKRIEEQYFFLNGLRGRELKSMTVGVIGTGKIGTATIQDLSGFGCRILANGHHPNPEVQRLAEQVDLETLLEQSDIVVLHCPMSEQNYHMINAGTIQKMKPEHCWSIQRVEDWLIRRPFMRHCKTEDLVALLWMSMNMRI